MSYAVKKAGVGFKAKVETSADLTGQAAGFTAYYINEATGAKTDILGAFTEDSNAAGLYLSPEITVPAVGDYIIVVNNSVIGMDNHPTPIVVTAASIDDVKDAIDDLRVVADNIAIDVNGLDGANLQDIRDNLEAVKLLIDDQDGSSVNSIMEFVAQIDAALADGATGLAALSGYTDDVENMLLGTEFLADGTTPNPLFGANNADLKSLIENSLNELQGDLAAAQTAVETKITAAKNELITKTDALQAVVDANQATLENAGYGLLALKNLIDSVATGVATGETNILNVLNDATNGLAAIKSELVSRFDAVDSSLSTIDSKIDALGGVQGYRTFV